MPWERDRFAQQVREILASVEAPPVDAQVRLTLQKHLYRAEIFETDGRGHVTLLLRTILESENNGDALVEPIVSAVSMCMRPEWTGKGLAWIEAFDKIPLTLILQAMRSLDLFSEKSIGHYYAIAIQNKVAAILEPAARPATKPVQLKREKPPRALSRVPGVEAMVELGVKLLELRSTVKSNREFGRRRDKLFDVVARVYGHRPDIYRRLSWKAVRDLASPTMPAPVRQKLEASILAGERIGGPQIRRARQAHAVKRDQPAAQLAA
jgi:hypothetical protein